ncbi:MAG: hypothetical protein E4G95_07745 [Bacteroidia bacterium]|nr:MAG: hypothetical protein E4G95_07745 [Bacteroidia bacterium]
MYHLIIEHLGVRRCLAMRKKDDFTDELYIDCSKDHGCIPENHVRDIFITCAGDITLKKKAGIYRD